MELSAPFTRALLADFGNVYSDLLRIATRSTGSRDEARDLVHDTWLRLAEHAQAGPRSASSDNGDAATDLPRDATAYLATMARHMALDAHRRDQRLARHIDTEAGLGSPTAPDVADAVMYRQALAALDAALAELPERCRSAFVAHRLMGDKQPEIAARLGVSVNTVERELIAAGDHIESALMRWRGTPTHSRQPGRRRSLAALLGVAGLGISAPLAWQLWQHQRSEQVLWQATLDSPPGRQARHTLPDGSTLALDADSRAVLRYRGARREVELQQGAAFFTVVHDAARPFQVRADTVEVTVLGTRFGVERLPMTAADGAGRTDTAVLVQVESGRVRVSHVPNAPQMTAGSQAEALPQMLRELGAGESVRVQPDGQLQSLPGDAPAPWRHGELVFAATPLAQALARLQRYAPYPLTATPAAGRLPVSGRVRIAQARNWLQALPKVLPLRVHELPDGGGLQLALREG